MNSYKNLKESTVKYFTLLDFKIYYKIQEGVRYRREESGKG